MNEATALALAEHIHTLKLALPDPFNPNFMKMKALRAKAASDILAIQRSVDPGQLRGAKNDDLDRLISRLNSAD